MVKTPVAPFGQRTSPRRSQAPCCRILLEWMLTAIAWFLVALATCLIGAVAAAFTVTTRDNLNAWVATGFACGALISLTFIAIVTAKPT